MDDLARKRALYKATVTRFHLEGWLALIFMFLSFISLVMFIFVHSFDFAFFTLFFVALCIVVLELHGKV